MQVINKVINLDLASIDDDDALVLEAFQKQATKEKWTQEEIDAVVKEAMSGDKEHLYDVLWDHCVYDLDEWEKIDESLDEEIEIEELWDEDAYKDLDDIDWESEDFDEN